MAQRDRPVQGVAGTILGGIRRTSADETACRRRPPVTPGNPAEARGSAVSLEAVRKGRGVDGDGHSAVFIEIDEVVKKEDHGTADEYGVALIELRREARADNVRFYRRRGFEVVHEGEVPDHGLEMWAMLRHPRLRPPAEQGD